MVSKGDLAGGVVVVLLVLGLYKSLTTPSTPKPQYHFEMIRDANGGPLVPKCFGVYESDGVTPHAIYDCNSTIDEGYDTDVPMRFFDIFYIYPEK